MGDAEETFDGCRGRGGFELRTAASALQVCRFHSGIPPSPGRPVLVTTYLSLFLAFTSFSLQGFVNIGLCMFYRSITRNVKP